MQNAAIFIFRTLLELYIITFVLRLIMQWVRADFRNPLAQFIVRVTNPLVVPLRRLIPSARSLDTATLAVVLLMELLMTAVLINLACIGNPDIAQLILLTLLRVVYLVLRIYLFVILIYVICRTGATTVKKGHTINSGSGPVRTFCHHRYSGADDAVAYRPGDDRTRLYLNGATLLAGCCQESQRRWGAFRTDRRHS